MAKSKKKKQNTPAPTAFNPFKLPNYSNRKELEAAYSKIFARSAEEAEKMRNDPTNSLSLDYLDLDPIRIRRRRKATLQYVDQAKQLVSEICPEIHGAFYIEEEWAEINALFMPTYDMYEPDELLIYAAALWLLDRIQENGMMREVSEILPHDSLLLDDLDSPILYDPSYCSDIVNGVVWVIRNRNSDCTGLKVPEPAEGNVPRTYMDDYTAAGRQHQDVPSRQRFEKLLALAGRENLEHAAEHYEEKLWELVRLYFAYRKPYTEEERGFADQRSRFTDMVLQNTNALQKEVSQRKSNVKPSKKTAPFTPLMKQPTPELFSSSRNLMERNAASKEDEFLLALMDMDREEEKLKKRYTQMLRSNATRCITFCEFINYSREGLIKLMDENCAELLTGFDIGDPYEMSAALLWLIDADSELPWLYFPGICLMSAIAGRLPWHKGFFDPTIDSWWDHGYGDDRFHLTENAARPKSLQLPEAPDWYGLNCIGKYDGDTDFERTNLAQIVYQITGAVIPRNTSRYDDAAIILKRFGVTGKRALSPILPAISMLGISAHQETVIRQAVWSPDEPEPEEPAEDTEDPEVYKQAIRELKEQIASLKQAHHDAAREAKNAQKKLEEQEETWEAERQELANLRELVYNQAQGTTESATAAKGVSFPYSAAHRIVVFGGHDSWLKAIRPMLPDVRFVGTQPNADLIRHADMVWIQPNCIGHGDFYKLINVVRTHHIPIYYFSCASAAKCAEELVRVDTEGVG